MLIARWLWGGRSVSARLARVALIPPSLVFRGVAAARTRAYRFRLLRCGSASVPTIAVGNLTVGGSGKTPIAAWIARYYSGLGLKPGIVLRGYGGDEGAVHRKLVREAVVIENPDRLAGASQAVSEGADVIVLDDAYQRLDIVRDLNIAVVSAESAKAPQWTLPAGPWREGWRALRRADLVIVSRKRATRPVADAMVRRVEKEVSDCPIAVARLGIACFHRLSSGERLDASAIDGANVVAAAGVADPDAFAGQCRAMGATVRLVPWRDHQRLSDHNLRQLAFLGSRADFVIVTEKDAVKMRGRWPDNRSEPIVAKLDLSFERGGDNVRGALNAAVANVKQLAAGS
jgi:tetraacyldisaccharide 4'-kinase